MAKKSENNGDPDWLYSSCCRIHCWFRQHLAFLHVAGNEGGAAFVLIYLGVIFFFGYPLLCTRLQ